MGHPVARDQTSLYSTTSIYSGLLRMSDLLSMQPNLNTPLYRPTRAAGR